MSLEQLLAWIPPGSSDETLARQVNFEQLPAHIAIIMDGNGRWAAQRHLPRVEGHRAQALRCKQLAGGPTYPPRSKTISRRLSRQQTRTCLTDSTTF